MTTNAPPLATSVHDIKAPLLHKGKVRELYDLGDALLLVVTDRISAHDYVLEPPIPGKGDVLNRLSQFWFEQTGKLIENHFIHADVSRLVEANILQESDALRYANRITVGRKAKRIDIECVVRGYLTGGGWRQYEQHGEVNAIKLPQGLRKNARLAEPIFTPAAKNDTGHDEDIPFAQMAAAIGQATAEELRHKSLALYEFAHDFCQKRGVILADCKFEFGWIGDKLVLIDEIFTPDAARFWAEAKYALDIEIDSMDKEPVRQFLSHADWDRNGAPPTLPDHVVLETQRRYLDIFQRLTDSNEKGGLAK